MIIEQSVASSLSGVFQCLNDEYLTISFAGEDFYDFFGYSHDELDLKHRSRLTELFAKDNFQKTYDVIFSSIGENNSFSTDVEIVDAYNNHRWIRLSGMLLSNSKGEKSIYCIYSDVTQHKQEQLSLNLIKDRYQFIVDNTQDIIFEWDYITKNMYQMGGQSVTFGYKSVLQNFPFCLINETSNLHPDDVKIFSDNYLSYEHGAKTAYAEYRIKSTTGIYFWCATTSAAVFRDGKVVKVLGKISNINDQKTHLLEISRKAMRDPLTELYNKKAFESLVNQYIASTQNMAALLIIDLDNFKLINDTFGHLKGDDVLNNIALDITQIFKSTDIVGRIGGDEFVVFVTDISTEEDISQLVLAILNRLEKTVSNLLGDTTLSGSIGISVYPKDSDTYKKLLDKADIALYNAKATGKNKFVFYNNALIEKSLHKNRLYTKVRKRTLNESQQREDLYRIALEKSKIILWEYDIIKRRISKILTPSHTALSSVSYENFPIDLIEKGYIHKNSIEPILSFYKRLESGEKELSCDVCLFNERTSAWVWQKISYTVIFDDDGIPYIAVGTSTDITQRKNTEMAQQHDIKLRTVLEKDIISTSITNLTKNIVEQYKHIDNHNVTYENMSCYEDIITFGVSKIVNPEDIKRYTSLSREVLLDGFSQGKTEFNVEFRRVASDGHVLWTQITASLLTSPQTGDIYSYIIVRNIDSKKRLELALTSRAYNDELTGVYTQDTSRELMDSVIKSSYTAGKDFALIGFSINFIDDDSLHSHEKRFDEIALALSHIINYRFSNQIIGRFFENQFFVLTQNFQEVEETANAVLTSFNQSLQFKDILSSIKLSCSVVFKNDSTKDFDSTYSYSILALNISRHSSHKGCIVYASGRYNSSSQISQYVTQGTPNDRLLKVAFTLNCENNHCLGIDTAVIELGSYYRAQWVLCYEMLAAKEQPHSLHVWASTGLTHVEKDAVSDFSATCPYMFKILEEDNFFICRDIETLREVAPTDYENLKKHDIKSLLCCIVKNDTISIGYILVINPTQNLHDYSFFDTLSRFLTADIEKRYLNDKSRFLSIHDALTSLLNRNHYIEYAKHLNPDILISLGILSVDINSLKQINTEKGHFYGDLAIKTTADALKKVFTSCACYRFAGDEFLVICENISKLELTKRIDDFKDETASFLDFDLAFGYSWADIDINLDNLVSYADEMMLSSKQQYYNTSTGKSRRYDPNDLEKLRSDIKKGYYHIYLQPKVHASSGLICGAEALVRYIHPIDGMISPDKFIPRFEATRIIKDLDLHVASLVCKTLRDWIDRKKTIYPISLNLSRATIISNGIIDELCAIVDSYDIKRGIIEIEITESYGGDMGREKIIELGLLISAAGFKLSLDDFGSKYSNLSVLSCAKWDTVKLDKSIINDITTSRPSQIIVENLFATCKKLGMATVAEGVETADQVEILKYLFCDSLQGYYFNKPIPVESFEAQYLIDD